MDLFGQLLFDAIDRASSRSPMDADLARQRIEEFLSSDGASTEEEARALESYLGLDYDEFLDLSPSVHEWMLERVSMARIGGDAEVVAITATRVARAFFVSEMPTVRLLAINALLAIDRFVEASDSVVSLVWTSLLNAELLSTVQADLDSLGEILLDLHFLSTDRSAVRRALEGLVLIDRNREQRMNPEVRERAAMFGHRFRNRIARRAEVLSPELAEELTRLLRHDVF